MLAAKLFGPGDVRLVECPVPEPGAGEILIRTGAAAICGTDLRMIASGYRGVDSLHPLTLGHEISGIIERVGPEVNEYKPDMRVSLAPNVGCGTCGRCIEGNSHLCETYRAFGINMDGGFAEYVLVPADVVSRGNVLVLPDSVSFVEAALFEPMSCVINGQELVRIHPNDTVLVIGAGPIGLMHLLAAKMRGAGRLFIRDLSSERMDQCEKLIPFSQALRGEDLKRLVMERTGGRGVDVCIVACPSPAAQAGSLELMAMNGRILFFGGLPAGHDEVSLPSNLIHYRQLSIHGSTRASVAQYRSVADSAHMGLIHLESLVSNTYPLEEFMQAVEFAQSAKGLKTVIQFDI